MISINSEESKAAQKSYGVRSGHPSGRVVENTFQRKILLLRLTEMVFCISRFNGCSMPAGIRASSK